MYGSGASGSSGTVEGIFSSLCQCHQRKQQNGIGKWTEKTMHLTQEGHPTAKKSSVMHREAEELEAHRVALQQDNIMSAFSSTM